MLGCGCGCGWGCGWGWGSARHVGTHNHSLQHISDSFVIGYGSNWVKGIGVSPQHYFLPLPNAALECGGIVWWPQTSDNEIILRE